MDIKSFETVEEMVQYMMGQRQQGTVVVQNYADGPAELHSAVARSIAFLRFCEAHPEDGQVLLQAVWCHLEESIERLIPINAMGSFLALKEYFRHKGDFTAGEQCLLKGEPPEFLAKIQPEIVSTYNDCKELVKS